MRWLLPALVLFGTYNALAQSSPPDSEKNDSKAPARCTVSGQVVSVIDNSPLKSARVTLVVEHTNPLKGSYQAVSDGEGRFLLKDVAPGRYEFFASRAGFVTEHYQSNDTSDGAVLALKAGENTKAVLFRMTPAAVITGRVNDEEGEPMANVQVSALQLPTDDELEDEGPFRRRARDLKNVASASTDDRGQYRIFGLKPGGYYVKAAESYDPFVFGEIPQDVLARHQTGTAYSSLFYPGTLLFDEAQLISLRAGEELQADFSMRHTKTVTVAGRVVGLKGPVTNASVNIGQPELGQYFDEGTETDEKGNFTLKGVPAGSFTVYAYARAEGEKFYAGREKIEVGSDDIHSITILLGVGATIHGRITVGGPGSVALERLDLILFPTDEEQPSAFGRTEKNGSFEVNSVKDGSYTVYVHGLEHDWYVKSMRVGREDVLENGLQVEKGNVGGTLEIVVSSDSARVEGAVSQNDKPIIGARVRIAPDPETPYNRRRSQVVKTDQSGHFLAKGLAPGKYRVVARMRTSPQNVLLTSDPHFVTLYEHDQKGMDLAILPPSDEAPNP